MAKIGQGSVEVQLLLHASNAGEEIKGDIYLFKCN